MDTIDQLPRVFQANADRFYQRVILEAFNHLPIHDTLIVGEAKTIDEFLDHCAAQVDNHTANEAAKAFALTFDGMFERQLSRWASRHGVKAKGWEDLLKGSARIASLDLMTTGMSDDLYELHLVANVVRHGGGRSCDELKARAPGLWDNPSRDYYDLAPGLVPVSDELRIRPDDLRRYARAVTRFWGHVDPRPDAMLNPPY